MEHLRTKVNQGTEVPVLSNQIVSKSHVLAQLVRLHTINSKLDRWLADRGISTKQQEKRLKIRLFITL